MTQPRHHSAYEALANIAAGIVLQFGIGMAMIRWLGFHISAGQNLTLTALMTFASFARQYGIRRLFEGRRV